MSTAGRVLVLALVLPFLAAQDRVEPTFGHSRHGAEFDEGPRQAAYLMPGMSDQVHFPVAGLGAEAQRFFDQGVCQLHGFWYFEAERSFRQVATLHPDCAMACWGMAMANVDNAARAAGFAAQAVQRRPGASPRERRWIDAIADFYQIDAAAAAELQSADAEKQKAARAAIVAKNAMRDGRKLGREFVRALEAIVFAEPDDIEAKAFLAVQVWQNLEFDIEITSHAAVDALLDQVFAKAPLHPAHHYRIHLWDDEKAERALASAAKDGATAPGIAHQWHMSGHTYAELHRHAEAAWQQDASGRVDHAHMQRDRVMPFLIHNYGHNQEWLCRSLSYLGRVREALDLTQNLAELPRHPKHNRVGERRDIAGYARARLRDLCEDHELWDEAIALCRDGHVDAADDVRAEVARLSLLGRALFRLGRLDEGARVAADADALLPKARAERARAIDEAEDEAIAGKRDRKQTDQDLDDARRRGTDVVRAVLDLQRELRGERLLAEGDAKGAVAEFAAIDAFPKTLLADAHVEAGDAAKAVELLEAEVGKYPRRLPTLARLCLALAAAEQRSALAARLSELASVLVGADAGTPLLRRLDLAGVTAERAAAAAGAGTFPADFGPRPALDSLGPRLWSPVPAPGFDLPVAGGGRASLARGRPQLVIFYLGFGCLRCVEQLRAIAPKADDFVAAGIDLVAIGSDPADAAAAALAELAPDERFAFPLLADPELAAFKAWRCHDDFEGMPLHGTFLVDGDGRVRWQDISFEPFTEIDWLLAECRRLLALPVNVGAK